MHSGRVVQRQVLHLGELNSTQTASWQRTLEIVNEEDGARLQRRLFNLAWLRERGAHSLVGTPKLKLRDFEQHLTDADWTRASSEVEVKLRPEPEDTKSAAHF